MTEDFLFALADAMRTHVTDASERRHVYRSVLAWMDKHSAPVTAPTQMDPALDVEILCEIERQLAEYANLSAKRAAKAMADREAGDVAYRRLLKP